ncbi:hypothetical protein [Marinigracilibium pacificum]|uniref:Uncharacterized protein n=1 Tax=Marinigracilibium pacificum TaxID=2729599 RepID=A0A848IUM3_9BACT|nr:hypothetical protein [Marinigracilibium pacificum]NMM48037.1 hypothetical protein [Marinigracilibium pacificum]
MLYGLLIIAITWGLSLSIINKYQIKHPETDLDFLRKLIPYHLFLSIVYYLYAVFNPSDSQFYYEKILMNYRGPAWMDFYGTSTTFIEWIGYPFVRGLGFSYEAMMALFSFFGMLGFIYFYLFFKERIRFKNTFLGFDLVTLFFLLPNLHFWSGSFGKGSIIFFGIGLFFYSLNNIKKRWVLLLLSGLLIYHIRPHVMFVMLVSAIIGFTFSNKGVSTGMKVGVILIAMGAFAFIYQDVLSMVGIEQGQEFTQGLNLDHRASELAKATSGIDISNYSLPLQLFTFLYRPLFFDAPGMLGLIVSFENVFLLSVTIMFFANGGLKYIIKGDFTIKTAFISFLTVSIALAQISGNLGIAIRQKSQVMLLFLFIIAKMMDDKKMKAAYSSWKQKQRQAKIKAQMEAMKAD